MPRRFAPPARWPVQDASRYKPLDWFIPYERNARTHPESQIDLLASLLTKYGPDQDIVVDEDRIILKGHGRLLAAQQAGLSHFTFTQRIGLSEADKQSMRLADNQVALLSGWDKELVQGEIVSLKTGGYDILQLGFGEAQLRGWGIQIGTEAPPEEEIPEPPRNPIVRPGDLWTLGNHRLICGDCTDAETVSRVLGGKRPNLMVTDPPYGVDYDPAWRAEPGRLGAVDGSFLSTGGVRRGAVLNDTRADWTAAYDLFPGDIAYVWHGALYSSVVEDSLHRSRFETRAQIVWNKQHAPISRGDYHWKHECCWYMVRRGKTGNWQGDRRQTTIWDIANMNAFGGATEDARTEHGTQKPVECMKRPMENNASAGDYIYEPFCGSGTTIIAGEMTDRRVLAIEIDPAYCEVILTRWSQFANQAATLDGVPFEQVAASRRTRRRGRNARNAPGNSGESVSRSQRRRGERQQSVREAGNARQSSSRRIPAGEPSPVARDT